MATKQIVKSSRKKRPFQIFWEPEMQAKFTELVKTYDPDLSVASAIVKLVRNALTENWLPGYIRKERVISNSLAKGLDGIGKES